MLSPYAGYLQLYTWNKPCSYGIQCCSCSVFTICVTCNVISLVKYVPYLYISTFRSMFAVSKMAVVYSSLISCFPGLLLRYCLSDFEMVPVAPIIIDITSTFTFHMCRISVMRPSYFKIFSASFLITFLLPGIATYIDMHVYCLLSQIKMSGLLLSLVLSVRTCWFYNMVQLLLL